MYGCLTTESCPSLRNSLRVEGRAGKLILKDNVKRKVMKEKQANRSRFVGLRFTAAEFERIEQLRKGSTTPQISEFIRRVLFSKPVTFNQRNQSLDEFMAEMIQLRTELNSIGNNFNQAVRKLHTLSQIKEFQQWLQEYEMDKQNLLNRVGAIKDRINQISDLWLQ